MIKLFIKIIFALFVFKITDSLIVSVISYFAISYIFNKHLPNNQKIEESYFFNILFILLGALAKSDGHVSKEEIRTVEDLFSRLRLNEEQKKTAIALFNQGKSEDFNIDLFIKENQYKINQIQLKSFLIEALYLTSFSDGEISLTERKLLEKIASGFSIDKEYINQLDSNFKKFNQKKQNDLSSCYQLLGVSESNTRDEIKKAYRKLMKENHPDTMLAKGLPKEMLDLANEKSAKINDAYNQIISNNS